MAQVLGKMGSDPQGMPQGETNFMERTYTWVKTHPLILHIDDPDSLPHRMDKWHYSLSVYLAAPKHVDYQWTRKKVMGDGYLRLTHNPSQPYTRSYTNNG